MNEFLFVYGTLLSSYDNKQAHAILNQHASFLGLGSINGKLFMVDYYPGAVKSEEKSLVKGEIYQLKNTDKLFEILDKYEEYNPNDVELSEFVRTKVTVKLKNGEQIEAWTYLYNQPTEDLELLPKGDFLQEYHK